MSLSLSSIKDLSYSSITSNAKYVTPFTQKASISAFELDSNLCQKSELHSESDGGWLCSGVKTFRLSSPEASAVSECFHDTRGIDEQRTREAMNNYILPRLQKELGWEKTLAVKCRANDQQTFSSRYNSDAHRDRHIFGGHTKFQRELLAMASYSAVVYLDAALFRYFRNSMPLLQAGTLEAEANFLTDLEANNMTESDSDSVSDSNPDILVDQLLSELVIDKITLGRESIGNLIDNVLMPRQYPDSQRLQSALEELINALNRLQDREALLADVLELLQQDGQFIQFLKIRNPAGSGVSCVEVEMSPCTAVLFPSSLIHQARVSKVDSSSRRRTIVCFDIINLDIYSRNMFQHLIVACPSWTQYSLFHGFFSEDAINNSAFDALLRSEPYIWRYLPPLPAQCEAPVMVHWQVTIPEDFLRGSSKHHSRQEQPRSSFQLSSAKFNRSIYLISPDNYPEHMTILDHRKNGVYLYYLIWFLMERLFGCVVAWISSIRSVTCRDKKQV